VLRRVVGSVLVPMVVVGWEVRGVWIGIEIVVVVRYRVQGNQKARH